MITELDIGGAEKSLVRLATGLNRRLWSPRVVALGPEGALAEPIRAAGIEVVCLGVTPRRPVHAIRTLVGTLRRPRPALIQSFLFHANVATRLAAPWTGRPWVLGGLRVAEHQKRWHLGLERLTGFLAAGAVCVSEGVRRFSHEVGGWPEDRLTVIGNAVDPVLFDAAEPAERSQMGVPDGAFLTLFVGRLNVQKGLPTLLDAAERLITERPDWHLVIVGDGPERDWLRARISRSPSLTAHVHPLGWQPNIPALLRAADLLVLPSLWEGMPNIVLEAMAARRAVVATNVEGSEDVVVPGATGWLVPPREVDDLLDALRQAAADPERLRRFGDAGRARVEAEFSPQRAVLAYETLWARVLGLDDRPINAAQEPAPDRPMGGDGNV